VSLQNTRNDSLAADVTLAAPAGWQTSPAGTLRLDLPIGGTVTLDYALAVSDPVRIGNSNRAWLQVTLEDRPAEAAIPVVLVGARRWLLLGPLPSGAASLTEALDYAHAAELAIAGPLAPAVAEGWHGAPGYDNALPLPADWIGVHYARLFLRSAWAREVRMGVPASCPRKLWLNGELVHSVPNTSLLRPNYGGDHDSYVDVQLREGWNEILVKYVRDSGSPAFAAHFTLATTEIFHGIHDVAWTRLPWELDTNK
jgi:hypothetical protein